MIRKREKGLACLTFLASRPPTKFFLNPPLFPPWEKKFVLLSTNFFVTSCVDSWKVCHRQHLFSPRKWNAFSYIFFYRFDFQWIGMKKEIFFIEETISYSHEVFVWQRHQILSPGLTSLSLFKWKRFWEICWLFFFLSSNTFSISS